MRVIYLSLSCLVFASPAVLAQDASTGFDPAAAVRGFLTDSTLLGADSATVGKLTEDGDTVTAEDVAMHWSASFSSADKTITVNVDAAIPSLTVKGLAPAGDGHSADSLEIPAATFVVDVEGAPEKINYELTVTGYSMTEPKWDAFPVIKADPAAPVSRFAPLIDWGVKQSYQRGGAEEVKGVFVAGDEKQEMAYGPAFFGPVVDGKLDKLEYGPFVITQKGEVPTPEGGTKPVDLNFDYGLMVGEGVDLNPVAQFLTGNGDATGLAPVIASFTMDGFAMSAEGEFAISIGGLDMQDFGLDVSRGPLLQKLDPAVLAAMEGTPPSPAELISLMLDLYGAYGIGRYEISDMEATAPDMSASLATMIVQNFTAAGLERFAVEGVSVDSSQGKAELETVEVRDLTFPERGDFMDMMIGQMMGIAFTPSDLSAMPTLGGFSIKGLSSDAGGTPFKLDLFDLNLSNFVEGIPTSIAVALEGLELPLSLVSHPMAQMVLGAVGADPVAADLSLTLSFDPESGNFSLDNDTAIGNVGNLTASASLSGIPAEILKNPMQANEAIATAAVDGLTVRFDDKGITPFMVGMMAEQAGVSASEFAEGMAAQVQMQIGMMTGDTALAGDLGQTVQTYLEDPQSLLINAAPGNPVPFAQLIGAAMAAPKQIPKLLNLTITANP